MEFPANYLDKFKGNATKKQIEEYGDLVNTARKFVKQPFIVFHKRIESAFPNEKIDFVLSNLRRWVHEAEKHPNSGLIINSRMKQYKEKTP